MEYNKFLVSLYKKDCPLPKMFVLFDKRSDKLVVSLKQNNFRRGILVLYDLEKFSWCDIKSTNDEFTIKQVFGKDKACIIGFFAEDIYFGKNGDVKINDDIVDRFYKIYNKISTNKQNQEDKEFDKHLIVDNISLRLFGELCEDYFEEAKRGFLSLFSLGKREEWIEKKINLSKFVCVGEGDSKICVGIIYKNKRPYGLAIGNIIDGEVGETKNKLEFGKKYFKNEQDLWEFTIRKTSDGDIL